MKELMDLLGEVESALEEFDGGATLEEATRRELRRRLTGIVDRAENAVECLDPDGGDRHDLLERALAAMSREQYGEAAELLERAVGTDPSDVELWNHLGLARWETGNFDGAEEAYRRAMEAGLESLGRDGGNRCSEPSSEYLRAVEGRALSLYRTGAYDRAVELFETLATGAPGDFAGCHYLAGESRHLQGRPERAVDHYRRAPEEPSVWYNMGLALYQIGEDEEAARTLVRAIVSNPHIAVRLLDRRGVDVMGPGGYLGSATYAEEFVEACHELWGGADGAAAFLKDCFEHPNVEACVRAADGDDSQQSPSETGGMGARQMPPVDGVARDIAERAD